MTVIAVRITVAPDGAILGHAPEGVPAGEHMVALTLPTAPQPPGTPSILDDLPSHDMGWGGDDLPSHDMGPWPEGLSLRREDMYGDDGR